jgi:hypothetical protein
MGYWDTSKYSSDSLFRFIEHKLKDINEQIAGFQCAGDLSPSSSAYLDAVKEFSTLMAPEAQQCLAHERIVNDLVLTYDQAKKWPKELHTITPPNGLPSISIFTPGVSSTRLTQDNLHCHFPGDPAVVALTPYVVVGNFSDTYGQVNLRGFSKNRTYDWEYTVKLDSNGAKVKTYWEEEAIRKFRDGVTQKVADLIIDSITVYISTGMAESKSVKSQNVVKEGLIKLYGG